MATPDSDPRRRLTAAKRGYERAERSLEAARAELLAAIIYATIDHEPPVRVTDVEDLTPYNREHIRRLRNAEWERRYPDRQPPWVRATKDAPGAQSDRVVVEVDARQDRLMRLWEQLDAEEIATRLRGLTPGRLTELVDAVEGTAAYRERQDALTGTETAEQWRQVAQGVIAAAVRELGPERWPRAIRDLIEDD